MSPVDEDEYDDSYSSGFNAPFASLVGVIGYGATGLFFCITLWMLFEFQTSDAPAIAMIAGANLIITYSVVGIFTLLATKTARGYLT